MSPTRQDLRDLAARFDPMTGRELDKSRRLIDTDDPGKMACRLERMGLSYGKPEAPMHPMPDEDFDFQRLSVNALVERFADAHPVWHYAAGLLFAVPLVIVLAWWASR